MRSQCERLWDRLPIFCEYAFGPFRRLGQSLDRQDISVVICPGRECLSTLLTPVVERLTVQFGFLPDLNGGLLMQWLKTECCYAIGLDPQIRLTAWRVSKIPIIYNEKDLAATAQIVRLEELKGSVIHDVCADGPEALLTSHLSSPHLVYRWTTVSRGW